MGRRKKGSQPIFSRVLALSLSLSVQSPASYLHLHLHLHLHPLGSSECKTQMDQLLRDNISSKPETAVESGRGATRPLDQILCRAMDPPF